MASQKRRVPRHIESRLSRIHALTFGEMKRLLSVISDLRDRALFLIAYRHGLRASEIVQMEKVDVDFAGTKLLVRRIGRGANDRHPLQKDEVGALKEYLKARVDKSVAMFLGLREKPITRRGLDWLMKSYGALAKLPAIKCHFHVLKHSVATHLLGAGVKLEIVHQWLGHTALKNTAHYIFLASPQRNQRLIVEVLGNLPT